LDGGLVGEGVVLLSKRRADGVVAYSPHSPAQLKRDGRRIHQAILTRQSVPVNLQLPRVFRISWDNNETCAEKEAGNPEAGATGWIEQRGRAGNSHGWGPPNGNNELNLGLGCRHQHLETIFHIAPGKWASSTGEFCYQFSLGGWVNFKPRTPVPCLKPRDPPRRVHPQRVGLPMPSNQKPRPRRTR